MRLRNLVSQKLRHSNVARATDGCILFFLLYADRKLNPPAASAEILSFAVRAYFTTRRGKQKATRRNGREERGRSLGLAREEAAEKRRYKRNFQYEQKAYAPDNIRKHLLNSRGERDERERRATSILRSEYPLFGIVGT